MTAREDSLNLLLAATAGVVDDFADEVTLLRDEVLQLRGAMETRAPIEQARGMVMMRYGLSADAAFRLLLRWSRTQGIEVRVLAVALVKLGIDEGGAAHHRQALVVSSGVSGPAERLMPQPLDPADAIEVSRP